jgi:hypothetical protein
MPKGSMTLNPDVQKEKKYSARCSHCKKKLGLMEYVCKCKKLLCISHLQPQEHACSFDYKAEADIALAKYLETETYAPKFEKI